MKINVLSIAKNDSFDFFYQTLIRQCKQFGVTLNLKDILTPSILKAQKISAFEAQKSYSSVSLHIRVLYILEVHMQLKEVVQTDLIYLLFTQFPPMVVSYESTAQYYNQNTEIGTVKTHITFMTTGFYILPFHSHTHFSTPNSSLTPGNK